MPRRILEQDEGHLHAPVLREVKPVKTKREKELERAKRDGIVIPGLHDFEVEFEPLTYSTKVKGQYEQAIKEVFLELGLQAAYEPLRFRIVGNDIYPPDFVMRTSAGSMMVDGKIVVFETHNGGSSNYLKRMSIFRQNYGEDFYLILVSSHDNFRGIGIEERVTLNSEDPALRVDERWKTPKILVEGTGIADQKDHEAWKEVVRALIVDLMSTRATVEISGAPELEKELVVLARA